MPVVIHGIATDINKVINGDRYAYWITRAPYHCQEMTPAGTYPASEGACDANKTKINLPQQSSHAVRVLVIIYSPR